MRLFIVRHGETAENAARIVMGQHGGRLSQTGRAQALEIALRLRGEPIHCIYTSDLPRAFETAGILQDALGSKILIETRLREQHFGEYEGRPLTTLLRRMKQTGEDFLGVNPPGGEPSEMFRGRIQDFFGEIENRHQGDSIMLVTHHGVITILLASLLRDAPGSFARDLLRHGVILLAEVDAGDNPALRYSLPGDRPSHWNMVRGTGR